MTTQTPKELRSSQIVDWVDELEDLGADLTPLAKVIEQTEIVRRLEREYHQLRQHLDTAPSPRAAAAAALARGEDNDDKSVRRKVLTRDDIQDKLDTHALAIEKAGAKAWALLTGRKDANLDLIRPAYMAAAQEMIAMLSILGGARITLDEAARRGHASEWLRLEAASKTIDGIVAIHQQWLTDRIVNHRGKRSAKSEHDNLWNRYDGVEFYYEDRLAADAAPSNAGMFAKAATFAAAGPALRSIADIDAKWSQSLSDEERAASLTAAYRREPSQFDGDREKARAAYMDSISLGNVFR